MNLSSEKLVDLITERIDTYTRKISDLNSRRYYLSKDNQSTEKIDKIILRHRDYISAYEDILDLLPEAQKF